MADGQQVKMAYYSDVLCIWAYCAQERVEELKRRFAPTELEIQYHFIPVFGSTAQKIGAGWSSREGFAGYNRHVQEVARSFSHVAVHPELWERTRPASSASPHGFLKAVQLVQGTPSPVGGLLERAAWALRVAFFRDARDVATRAVQWELAEELGLPRDALAACMDDGRAVAALFEDSDAQQRNKIEGSPSFVFNDGRQKLYGNVGYRVIEANVQELLRAPDQSLATWC